MLVLSRKKGEQIVINENIVVTVVDVRGDKVRLGIEAPRDVSVHRQEVADKVAAEEAEKSKPPQLRATA
jgi:carbon storage regulator